MSRCANCGEELETGFDACWSCGADLDGNVSPEFQHADRYVPVVPEEAPTQFSLGAMIRVVTALCLLLVLVAPSGAELLALPAPLRFVLGVGAAGYLALHLIGWWMTSRTQRLQRRLIQAQEDEQGGRKASQRG